MNSPQTTSPATVPATADRLDLIAVCSRLGHHVDFREWDRLPALFAPSVLVRHTGPDTPGEPVPTPSWRSGARPARGCWPPITS